MLCTKASTELSTNVLFPIISVSSSSISSVPSKSAMIVQLSGFEPICGWLGANAVLVDLVGDVVLAGEAGLVGVVCFEGKVVIVGEAGSVGLVGVVGLKNPSYHTPGVLGCFPVPRKGRALCSGSVGQPPMPLTSHQIEWLQH